MRNLSRLALGLTLLIAMSSAAQPLPGQIGTIDLMTTEGAKLVQAEWRYAPVRTGVGPDKNEIEPKAHGVFDDAKWEAITPESLKQPRGTGGYSLCWYRTSITIPNMVNGKPFTGGPIWFTTSVDDYGEVWVDGEIDKGTGKSGRGAVPGFNARNRVRVQKFENAIDEKTGKAKKVGRDPKPGEKVQLAILGINGPIGSPPGNQIFLHAPTRLEFFAADAPNAGANELTPPPAPPGKEVGKIDLMTKEGVAQIGGVWRRTPITVHTGPKENGIEPRAHAKFDDSQWDVVADPATLKARYGPLKFSMAWYRLEITIPEKVGEVSTAGKSVWFRTTVDDYGEIWVDGKCDLALGKAGRGGISGFNTQNEVKLTDNAKPGQKIQLAILTINSPLGNPPGNAIFLRSPTDLRFFDPPTK